MIAASQIPFQFMLALKSLNPFAWVFRSSHEELNKWHRTLGRIISVLLIFHAILYLNYFVGVGILKQRLFASIVLFGVAAFICLGIMNTTALSVVRNYSYRAFFITHIMGIFAIPPLVFFHANPARPFMVVALACLVVDLCFRKMSYTVAAHAKLESIPGTNLVKIAASVPFHKINSFRRNPGSHIYLSIPTAARPSANPASIDFLLFELMLNPFTVASVDEESGDIILVARQRDGPLTRRLARFANAGSAPGEKIPLSIEGPYGSAAKNFSTLVGPDIDRVLLVAGGVGATFAVPTYRAILTDHPNAKVELVWAVRGAGDATWAVTGSSGASVLNDDNVHVYLTGDILGTGGGGVSDSDNGEGEVEMSAMYRDRRRNKYTSNHNRKRPNLQKIVDDTFKHGNEERIAVLVCGPKEMARDLRECVGAWVMKGRYVLWHNESFGW
jgi:NAD(P)H-flavin reductase